MYSKKRITNHGSLKIKFGADDSIEVEDAMNVGEVAELINRSLKKFFYDTKYVKDQKEEF